MNLPIGLTMTRIVAVPLLIVFLGVVVGGIVICMFLPIFKMSEIINPPSKK